MGQRTLGRMSQTHVAAPDRLYFRQLLSGRDFAGGDQLAEQMVNFAYAIGDRDKMLFNRDGSLDILVQHEAPSAERKSNWLPAPEGPFTLLLRLYSPKPAVLDGQWVPPPVRPAQAPAYPAAAR